MAYAYPFFAFCSDVLNDPTTRYEFTTEDMQDALIDSYGLTAAQTTAVKTRDDKKIISELQKELNAVKKSPSVKSAKSFICW